MKQRYRISLTLTMVLVMAFLVVGCAPEKTDVIKDPDIVELSLDAPRDETLPAHEKRAFLCPPDLGMKHVVSITQVSSGDAEHLGFEMTNMMAECSGGESASDMHCRPAMMMGMTQGEFVLSNRTAQTLTFQIKVHTE